MQAARGRGDALDHVLFFGPPGLGKTTLAQIVAREMAVGFRATSGPVIAKAGDLAAILTNLQAHDVLFIDEIHRLSPAVEEVLYPAMEDFHLDIIIGEGPAARSVRIDLPPFTLIGATTRSGLITTRLRERFGIPMRLQFYEPEELQQIVSRGARVLNIKLTEDGAAGDRAAFARYPAGGRPLAAPGARFRRRRRPVSMSIANAPGRRRAAPPRRGRARPRCHGPALSFAAWRTTTAAVRWAWKPSPPPFPKQRDVLEEVIEPYLPDPAGPHPAHAARPGALARRLCLSGPCGAAQSGAAGPSGRRP